MSDEEKLLAEARILATLDGCEGGDLLYALCGALEMSHYSYASEEVLTFLLSSAIEQEVRQHRENLENLAELGYDPEDVARALRDIETIRRA